MTTVFEQIRSRERASRCPLVDPLAVLPVGIARRGCLGVERTRGSCPRRRWAALVGNLGGSRAVVGGGLLCENRGERVR
jgi:hypothetical protein